MKCTQISANAWKLTRLGLFNAYFVRESDGLTLIDTSLPRGGEDILQLARKVGSPVNRILLTHAHGDHVGSTDQLHHLLGRVDLAISQRESRLLPKKPAQDRSLDSGEPQCKVKGNFPKAETTCCRRLCQKPVSVQPFLFRLIVLPTIEVPYVVSCS